MLTDQMMYQTRPEVKSYINMYIRLMNINFTLMNINELLKDIAYFNDIVLY